MTVVAGRQRLTMSRRWFATSVLATAFLGHRFAVWLKREWGYGVGIGGVYFFIYIFFTRAAHRYSYLFWLPLSRRIEEAGGPTRGLIRQAIR